MTVLTGPMGRLGVAVVMGCFLGAVGLPRLDLSALPVSNPFQRGPVADVVQIETAQTSSSPTPQAADSTPTAGPEPTVAAVTVPGVLLDERFGSALAQWPDDPEGTAWFADGAYRLYARQPTRFVAVGVPLPSAVGDAVLSAQFRKVGGPGGGGYGLIIRDQGPSSDRDGRSQDGQYLVVGVGDRGDIGVWHRDRTHWIDVVPWTHSDIVHQEMDTNSLVLTTHGAALRFEVNGQVVADLTYDGLPPTGGVGIFVGGDLNQVALESLRIDG
jgi:hypothetical protein